MSRTRVGTLVVVDEQHRLAGLLTERDMRFVARPGSRVADRMTPRAQLVVHEGQIEPDAAERVMVERKIKKLPLVATDGTLIGLITARDLVRQRRMPFATRDSHGRLRVGAAIGATGDYLERAAELLKADVDVIVIDIAHGHSVVMERAIADFRKRFGDAEMIAGNVATAEGAKFLVACGADGIKVGIGPGGGCTTRLTTSFGVPQVQALVECRLALGDSDVSVIADGGVKRHGALMEALLFGGDCAMLGSAFAGTERGARRGRPQVGRAARVAEDREGAVQGASRDGLARSHPGPARRRGCRQGGAGGHRRRRHGDQRARARLGADAIRPRHDQACLFVDQLRRRRLARRTSPDVLGKTRRRT